MVHHRKAPPRPGPETSYEERTHKHTQLVYSQQTRERQYFMQELQQLRKHRTKMFLRNITNLVGPIWYQVLSVPQRQALDTLEISIHQDLLEGRAVRTSAVIRKIGIYPRPNNLDLMTCNYSGRNDPKQMLSELFLITYGHGIDGKRSSYCLNARLLMSSIYYLGVNNLLHLLQERFKPDKQTPTKQRRPKPKPQPPLQSPYLQKMIAALYLPPSSKKFRPPPLPSNLDDLNEPYEEEPPIPKPPPPPPPPPPPKKRLARSFCDKVAGIMPVDAFTEVTAVTMKTTTNVSQKKQRGNMCMTEVKKTYGICITRPKKGSRRKKLKAPTTGIPNAQYLIQGVYQISGKTVFVLGSVSILPAGGDLIHGGFKSLDGGFINIHCGYRAFPPPPKPDPCDCVKQWQDSVMRYVKETKCYCRHHYDFGQEGTFPPEELQFFQKPTGNAPYQFNYHTIFDIDEKSLHIEKEFKKIWETDSVIGPKNLTRLPKKKKKRSSTTCLGQHPKPGDYLKCALRQMRRVNLAARLPDVHRAPELREWMRRRIYGPYSRDQRKEFLVRSNHFFQAFTTLADQGFGHVATKREPAFGGTTNWARKFRLNKKFLAFAKEYKMELFRSLARLNNLLWPAMYQDKFPDKKFREIYFSYLYATAEDMMLMHPYNRVEIAERSNTISKRRYICLPAGIEPEE